MMRGLIGGGRKKEEKQEGMGGRGGGGVGNCIAIAALGFSIDNGL